MSPEQAKADALRGVAGSAGQMLLPGLPTLWRWATSHRACARTLASIGLDVPANRLWEDLLATSDP
jgi:hypothetical protein